MDTTRITVRLSTLEKQYQRDAMSDIRRILDRAHLDQARDRALLEHAKAIAEHTIIARPLAGVVPDYLSTAEAMKKVNVHQTTWTDYLAAGLIAPVDPSAGKHQFIRAEVEALRDMPSGERRAKVREWKAKNPPRRPTP